MEYVDYDKKTRLTISLTVLSRKIALGHEISISDKKSFDLGVALKRAEDSRFRCVSKSDSIIYVYHFYDAGHMYWYLCFKPFFSWQFQV